MQRVFGICIVLVFLTGCIPAFANAQISSKNSTVVLTVIPENPAPGDQVTFLIEAPHALDINRARISWYLDGKLQANGIGQTIYKATLPKNGNAITVTASVTPSSGISFEKQVSIGGGRVDVVWQADTYTPPFYEGKALNSYQSKITFVALPHLRSGGREVDPSTCVYVWKKDGVVIGSGYGMQSVTVTGSVIARTYDIDVSVSSFDKSANASGHATMGWRSADMLLYENNPLYGLLLNKALGQNIELAQNEITVSAVPYFFSNAKDASHLKYSWLMNNRTITAPSDPATVVFRKDGASGVASVSLQIQNAVEVLQAVNKSFAISF